MRAAVGEPQPRRVGVRLEGAALDEAAAALGAQLGVVGLHAGARRAAVAEEGPVHDERRAVAEHARGLEDRRVEAVVGHEGEQVDREQRVGVDDGPGRAGDVEHERGPHVAEARVLRPGVTRRAHRGVGVGRLPREGGAQARERDRVFAAAAAELDEQAAARQHVAQHLGEVATVSTRLVGRTPRVHGPRIDRARLREKPASRYADLMPRSPLTVLVVDDDEGLRALLVGILSPGEHVVSAAASAEEALQLLPYQTFDLALLDHNLPGMEGLVLGEYLQRNNPRMEVVLVTGDDDPRVERSSLRAGLSFVAKPFLPRDIFDAVDRAYARLAERASDAPPPALEPVRLDAAARARIAEVFEGLNLPERWVARLQREARDRLAALKRRGDPVDRDVALACLVALALAGEKAPFEAYDAVAEAHGDRPIFGGRASTD